ncbi:hypothetical protein FKW77_008920 [Venturia effusa]|uniref:Uncharacterized protein n=1 Tax=Venturia effusa TaxID=50376 RepID=A0A517L413_9PEZI|nr:hypothetical protein FKW77_008920 [Venturia effusa]
MAASKSRTVILTGGVAAITAMGAWYGATLKTDVEVRQAKKEIIEASPEEKIERLEMRKARLMTTKRELEGKIAEARRKQKEEPT